MALGFSVSGASLAPPAARNAGRWAPLVHTLDRMENTRLVVQARLKRIMSISSGATMKNNYPIALFLILISCSLLLASCSRQDISEFVCGSPDRRGIHESYSGEKIAHYARTYDFTVDNNNESTVLTLQLKIQLIEGSVNWYLLEPNGKIAWRGEVSGEDTILKSQDFQPESGVWQLDIVVLNATGSYDFCWLN